MYVVNLCHISPWGATTGLFAAAARLLQSGGHLCVYGAPLLYQSESVHGCASVLRRTRI